MYLSESAHADDQSDAVVLRGAAIDERALAHGQFLVVCLGPDGQEKWRDTIDNVVAKQGKDTMLDAALAGSTYTVVGPYMGLISSVSWSAVSADDTMASHAGWHEAGTGTDYPLYTTPRKTCAWSAASGGNKALSAALAFPIITTGGTVKGCFIVFGTGALSTIGNTGGSLWSAGTFTGGDKVVGIGDTLNVSYTTGL